MAYRSGGPPHAYPKGLHGCYRGRLVRNPRLIERAEKSPMATGRIAVHMAAPNAKREDREALTEFVNVIAFDERVPPPAHELLDRPPGGGRRRGHAGLLPEPRRREEDQPNDYRRGPVRGRGEHPAKGNTPCRHGRHAQGSPWSRGRSGPRRSPRTVRRTTNARLNMPTRSAANKKAALRNLPTPPRQDRPATHGSRPSQGS